MILSTVKMALVIFPNKLQCARRKRCLRAGNCEAGEGEPSRNFHRRGYRMTNLAMVRAEPKPPSLVKEWSSWAAFLATTAIAATSPVAEANIAGDPAADKVTSESPPHRLRRYRRDGQNPVTLASCAGRLRAESLSTDQQVFLVSRRVTGKASVDHDASVVATATPTYIEPKLLCVSPPKALPSANHPRQYGASLQLMTG